jgi:hypothetical protein
MRQRAGSLLTAASLRSCRAPGWCARSGPAAAEFRLCRPLFPVVQADQQRTRFPGLRIAGRYAERDDPVACDEYGLAFGVLLEQPVDERQRKVWRPSTPCACHGRDLPGRGQRRRTSAGLALNAGTIRLSRVDWTCFSLHAGTVAVSAAISRFGHRLSFKALISS